MLSNAPTRHCGWLGFGRRYFGCYGFGCYSFGCHEFGRSTFGCCVFGRRGFGCCGFGCRERFLYWRFWMFFGCYELWMLCFWMLRTLDSTALDASIRSPFVCFVSCFRWFSRDVTNRRLTSAPLGECMRKLQLLVRLLTFGTCHHERPILLCFFPPNIHGLDPGWWCGSHKLKRQSYVQVFLPSCIHYKTR